MKKILFILIMLLTIGATAQNTFKNPLIVQGKTINGASVDSWNGKVDSSALSPINSAINDLYNQVASLRAQLENIDTTGIIVSPLPGVYVSATGSDTEGTGTFSDPFYTITKALDSVSAGGTIYMRGGTYNYTSEQAISKSGTAGFPITISAFPNEAPVISAFTTVSGWTNEGGGIYSKAVTAQSTPNIVTVNGINTPKGRYPNSDAAWGGYLNIDSHTSTTAITVSELNSTVTNWGGAEVVLKRQHWIIDKGTITGHSGSTLTYTGGAGTIQDNYGAFIQNDTRTFDVVGDWAYRSGTLYMYFGANNPTDYTVKISVLDKNIYSTKSYIAFKGITFDGANVYGIH